MPPTMMTRSAGRSAAASRGGGTGGQGSEVNGGVNEVPDFSTIIEQYLQNLLPSLTDGNLREISGGEAWETIENFAQGQKEWDNPPNIIFEQGIENLKVHAKRLFGNENVWVEMHRNIAWDKVENPNPQSTPQVPPSFEETTPHVTHPEEVDETIGIPTEVEPLDYTKLEDISLNTNTHDLSLSSKGFPSVDESEP
ncbi:hypothetical protein Tco_0046725 [Tanacetum coccineum]